MPQPEHAQSPEHGQTPQQRALGFERVIRQFGHGNSIKVESFQPDTSSQMNISTDPKVTAIPVEGTSLVTYETQYGDGSSLKHQFCFGSDGRAYQMVDARQGISVDIGTSAILLNSLRNHGFAITTPERIVGERDEPLQESDLTSGATIEHGAVFETGWKIPHNDARSGETLSDPHDFTFVGMRTRSDSDGNISHIMVKRSDIQNQVVLDGLPEQELVVSDIWVIPAGESRIQSYQERTFTSQERELLLRDYSPAVLADFDRLFRKEGKLNDWNVEENTLVTYPSREREAINLLKDRTGEVASATYHRLTNDMLEDDAISQKAVEARMLAVNILYDDGDGVSRSAIERQLHISEKTVREDILALRTADRSTDEETANKKETKQELSSEQQKIRDLFNGSFFFSQGQQDHQKAIMFWLIKKGHLDDVELPTETPDYIKEMPLPKRHAPIDGPANQLDLMYDTMQNMKYQYDEGTLLEDRYYQNHDVVEELSNNLLTRDFRFQTVKVRQGREDAEQPVRPDSFDDPRASILRRFVINGESTRIEAFDQMCAEMRASLANDIALERETEYASDREPRRTPIGKLQQAWEQNHPGEEFFSQYQLDEAVEQTGDEHQVYPSEPKVGGSFESIADAENDKGATNGNGGPQKGKSK